MQFGQRDEPSAHCESFGNGSANSLTTELRNLFRSAYAVSRHFGVEQGLRTCLNHVSSELLRSLLARGAICRAKLYNALSFLSSQRSLGLPQIILSTLDSCGDVQKSLPKQQELMITASIIGGNKARKLAHSFRSRSIVYRPSVAAHLIGQCLVYARREPL